MSLFYVLVRHGRLTGLIVGPFYTRAAANAFVEPAQNYASGSIDLMARFYDWGVAEVAPQTAKPVRPGRLNTQLGYAPPAALLASGGVA